MEWVGLTAIGFDDMQAPKYQYIGMIDEFYMFPCVLNARDIAAIQKHCGEYCKWVYFMSIRIKLQIFFCNSCDSFSKLIISKVLRLKQ